MVDCFLERGFNYFDTAHGYVAGKSEPALRDCLTSRYPRDRYILTDKLSTHHFSSEEEGKIKHFGISFHDRAAVLEQILTECPQIEAVQIQFNYADYEDPSVESRKVYETAERHGKPVIVMEPVKGGKCERICPQHLEIRKLLEDVSAEFDK